MLVKLHSVVLVCLHTFCFPCTCARTIAKWTKYNATWTVFQSLASPFYLFRKQIRHFETKKLGKSSLSLFFFVTGMAISQGTSRGDSPQTFLISEVANGHLNKLKPWTSSQGFTPPTGADPGFFLRRGKPLLHHQQTSYIYIYISGFLKSLRQNFSGIIPWGVGRVTESGFLLSESPYFLCRTAWARHALQA